MQLFPLLATAAAVVLFDHTVTTLVAAWAAGALITAAAQFLGAAGRQLLMVARARGWRSIMRRSVRVALANGAGLLCARIDVLVVAAVLSASAAGVYSIPVALAGNLLLLSRSLLTASYHPIMTAPRGGRRAPGHRGASQRHRRPRGRGSVDPSGRGCPRLIFGRHTATSGSPTPCSCSPRVHLRRRGAAPLPAHPSGAPGRVRRRRHRDARRQRRARRRRRRGVRPGRRCSVDHDHLRAGGLRAGRPVRARSRHAHARAGGAATVRPLSYWRAARWALRRRPSAPATIAPE